jgi:hypothetical protein
MQGGPQKQYSWFSLDDILKFTAGDIGKIWKQQRCC